MPPPPHPNVKGRLLAEASPQKVTQLSFVPPSMRRMCRLPALNRCDFVFFGPAASWKNSALRSRSQSRNQRNYPRETKNPWEKGRERIKRENEEREKGQSLCRFSSTYLNINIPAAAAQRLSRLAVEPEARWTGVWLSAAPRAPLGKAVNLQTAKRQLAEDESWMNETRKPGGHEKERRRETQIKQEIKLFTRKLAWTRHEYKYIYIYLYIYTYCIYIYIYIYINIYIYICIYILYIYTCICIYTCVYIQYICTYCIYI